MKLEVSADIAAPPDVVFATVADIENWPNFMQAIERLELVTPGPIAVGTKFRETRTMLGRSATEEMTVAALDPAGRFDLTAENHGTRYLARHAIESTPTGSRLKLVFEGTPVTLGARLGMVIGLMLKGAVRKQLQSDLGDIKAEAERRGRARSAP